MARRVGVKRKLVPPESEWTAIEGSARKPIAGEALSVVRSAKQATTEQQFAQYNELIERVVDVFGDDIVASKWLSAPSADFGDKSPLEVARASGYQVKVLEPVLVRIEHGVYF